jgi:hypothetical protein
MPTRHHVTTLATTSSWPNHEILAACEVLSHLCATFHPYMCGLRKDATRVAPTLINYDDVELLPG